MPRSPKPAAVLLALTLLGAPAAFLASGTALAAEEPEAPPTIYKWVDENGIAHYTTDRDRIPAGLRDRFDVPDRPEARPLRPAPQLPPTPTPTATPSAAAPPVPPPSAAPPAPAPVPTPGAEGRKPAPEPVHTAAPRPAPAPAPDTRVVERDFGAEPDFVAPEPGVDLEQRIRDLESSIQADEDALKALLGGPVPDAPLAVADDADLRAIAERLPERLAELDTLRAQRGGASGTP